MKVPNPEFSTKYKKLYTTIFDLYNQPGNKARLLFHGWHHIQFVHNKAIEFARELECDIERVAVASLVHDLNYIFSEELSPEAAAGQIREYIASAGYSEEYCNKILKLIEDSHTEYRGKRELSDESKALSDADTLFKALPTTPILFASKFISQNNYSIEKLGHKVVDEQKPLLDSGTYFYTKTANKKYIKWARINLEIWENVVVSLDDPDVKELLDTAYELGVL